MAIVLHLNKSRKFPYYVHKYNTKTKTNINNIDMVAYFIYISTKDIYYLLDLPTITPNWVAAFFSFAKTALGFAFLAPRLKFGLSPPLANVVIVLISPPLVVPLWWWFFLEDFLWLFMAEFLSLVVAGSVKTFDGEVVVTDTLEDR